MTAATMTHSSDGKSEPLKSSCESSCSTRRFVLLGVGLVVSSLLLAWTRTSPAAKASTPAPPNRWGIPSNKNNEFMTILYWSNTPGEEKRELEWSRQRQPQAVSCQQNQIKCMFSSDQSLAPESDALLIHVSKTEHYPNTRPTKQKWIFYEGSSPPRKKGEYPAAFYHHDDHFNVISTYSPRQSQIPASMIPWAKCKQSSTLTEKPIDFSLDKSRKVAWLANRCETGSAREDYITELSKHIHVDIIGKCNSMHCPRINARYRSVCVRSDPYLCSLCNYLHKTKDVVNRTLNIEQYWNRESLCNDADAFYSF
ncbi:hypothetical protein CAPTEDRAFT_211675 [Capitella teleta]|uniref:Fucosyltransferase n=1 Tax=Capitella teleta TaxID=283909 RepID=R7UM91_CAPTE|nr:hypothetical protein CAPTEDRAFT_211675 [Capitella teleta]|eukprot:ELU07634.1 hypothetical protein CAPTEDRAFT_211675 [Capitella teleta]